MTAGVARQSYVVTCSVVQFCAVYGSVVQQCVVLLIFVQCCAGGGRKDVTSQPGRNAQLLPGGSCCTAVR